MRSQSSTCASQRESTLPSRPMARCSGRGSPFRRDRASPSASLRLSAAPRSASASRCRYFSRSPFSRSAVAARLADRPAARAVGRPLPRGAPRLPGEPGLPGLWQPASGAPPEALSCIRKKSSAEPSKFLSRASGTLLSPRLGLAPTEPERISPSVFDSRLLLSRGRAATDIAPRETSASSSFRGFRATRTGRFGRPSRSGAVRTITERLLVADMLAGSARAAPADARDPAVPRGRPRNQRGKAPSAFHPRGTGIRERVVGGRGGEGLQGGRGGVVVVAVVQKAENQRDW